VNEPRDEAGLLAALAAGDRSAAEALADRTWPLVFRFLCRLCKGDDARAADLTQEAFRRCWAALGTFEGRSSFATWVCRAGYNAFLDERRHRQSSAGDGERDATRVADAADPSDGPADALIRAETRNRLHRAVLALPDPLRYLVAAHYWGEVPVAELARAERITTVGLRKRLRRAQQMIAAALGGHAP
jgi:RNA polymerase sigma-70 factor (ECF subfamily)